MLSHSSVVTHVTRAQEVFDDLVLACDAAAALRLLHRPSLLERRLLRNVTYFTDLCVTHTDSEYMAQVSAPSHRAGHAGASCLMSCSKPCVPSKCQLHQTMERCATQAAPAHALSRQCLLYRRCTT